jgi:hypothetical protein
MAGKVTNHHKEGAAAPEEAAAPKGAAAPEAAAPEAAAPEGAPAKGTAAAPSWGTASRQTRMTPTEARSKQRARVCWRKRVRNGRND